MPATSSPIGQPITRIEGRLKVTGGANYAAEFARPKLTYGVLIQSTIANGHVVKIDLSAAKSAPGVIGILTRENAPHFRAYPDDLSQAGAPGESRVPLQDDEIHYAGEHLGVVVAESFEQATYAVSLVRVTCQTQSPMVTLDDERAQKNAIWPEKFAGREALQVKRGDVDAALATAAHKIDFVYSTPIENHNPIETYSTTAEWEAPDQLLIHECTRGSNRLSFRRRRLRVEGIPMESHVTRRCGGKTASTTSEADSHPSADVRFRRPTRPHRAETFHRRRQNWQAGGVASRDDHAFFTHARLHRAMRQHVAHVVFVPERRGLAPTR